LGKRLSKTELDDIFEQTRPEQRRNKEHAADELVHLSYVRHAVATHLRHIPGCGDLKIDVSRADIEEPYKITSSNGKIEISYPKSANAFDEQLAVARGLADILMPKAWDLHRRASIMYLAEMLLEYYFSKNNGSILRRDYTDFDVRSEIDKRYDWYSSELSNCNTTALKMMLYGENRVITPKRQCEDAAVLSCERRLITEYMREKYNDESLRVKAKGAESLKTPKGNITPHGSNCEIIYTGIKSLEFYLDALCKFKSTDALRFIRYLISHELSHMVLHYHINPYYDEERSPHKLARTEDDCQKCEYIERCHSKVGDKIIRIGECLYREREATYFAYLLLIRRETLNNNEEKALKHASSEWEAIIRSVAKDWTATDGTNPVTDWVFDNNQRN
jgi:hypothetical protein